MRISVAMATFNGAKYLREQLDSLAKQKYLPLELVICDDRSSDDTLSIIQDFIKSAPFAVRVYENESNLGFANNFLKCASLCSGEWIAFCDQDDFWIDEKLAIVRNTISRSSDKLVLVYHVAELVDKDLKPVGIKLPKIERERVVAIAGNSGFWFVGGCVMCFKATLIKDVDSQLRPRDNYQFNEGWDAGKFPWMPHDKWICMLGNISGEVAAIPQILSLYRRHDYALTGAHANIAAATRIQKHLLTNFEAYKFLSKFSSETADALIKISGGIKSNEQQKFLIEGARKYMNISYIFNLRAELYESKSFFVRFSRFGKLMLTKAYWGEEFCPLNVYSFIKDFLFVVGLVSVGKFFLKRRSA